VNHCADENRLAETANVILLDADRVPLARRNLENDLWVAHRVAILLATMSDAHQFTAAHLTSKGVARPDPCFLVDSSRDAA
jgi:hypothetical protein